MRVLFPCALALTLPFLAGCPGGMQQLLPQDLPPGVSASRCTQASLQASGTYLSVGGRADSCQCIDINGGVNGSMRVKMPGCDVWLYRDAAGNRVVAPNLPDEPELPDVE